MCMHSGVFDSLKVSVSRGAFTCGRLPRGLFTSRSGGKFLEIEICPI